VNCEELSAVEAGVCVVGCVGSSAELIIADVVFTGQLHDGWRRRSPRRRRAQARIAVAEEQVSS